MKFYSEKLGKLFDTIEELKKTEAEAEKTAKNIKDQKDKIVKGLDDGFAKISMAIKTLDKIADQLDDNDEAEIISTFVRKTVELMATVRMF